MLSGTSVDRRLISASGASSAARAAGRSAPASPGRQRYSGATAVASPGRQWQKWEEDGTPQRERAWRPTATRRPPGLSGRVQRTLIGGSRRRTCTAPNAAGRHPAVKLYPSSAGLFEGIASAPTTRLPGVQQVHHGGVARGRMIDVADGRPPCPHQLSPPCRGRGAGQRRYGPLGTPQTPQVWPKNPRALAVDPPRWRCQPPLGRGC